MNNFYQTNMNQIRKGFPELYEKLLHIDAKKIRTDFLQIERQETNTAIVSPIVQTMDGRVIYLQSVYDPFFEASLWMDGQEKPDHANLMMFGLGSGTYAHELLARKSKTSKVVIYEPSPQLFLFALQEYDLREFFATPGVRVIVDGINEYMYSNVMEEMLDYTNFEDQASYICPQMSELFPAQVQFFIRAYHDGVGRLMSNRNTIRRFLHITPYNILYNLRYLPENTVVPKLSKCWDKEAPVLIVGAGPSLREDIEVLRTAGEKAYIFAVDSALPYLLSHDIVPDATICIEADKPMKYFADDRVNEIPLFCRVNTTHHLMEQHRGRKIFGFDEGFMEEFYHKFHVPCSSYRYGGNGSTSFFAIAKELGAKTVILVGQDMCYGADRQSHAGGRNEGFVADSSFVYENNKGEKVQSRQDWHRFIRWYENAIPVCRFEHVINTALSGVRIEGAEVMSLKDALAEYGRERKGMEEILEEAEGTFAPAFPFELQGFYEECMREWKKLASMTEKNPQSRSRTDLLLYQILELYEIADTAGDFAKSQKEGLAKIKEYLEKVQSTL